MGIEATSAADSWSDRIQDYVESQWEGVEGWAPPIVVNLLPRLLQTFHEAHDIRGDIAEIGVHHGKFFFALDALRRHGERALAADLFDQQEQNIDKSGKGDRAIFEKHLAAISHDPGGVTIYAGDSIDRGLQQSISAGGFEVRIFSVDGGHTAGHAMNDLRFAAEHLVNGGAVVLDDFCNIGWPGVTEALFTYLAGHPPIAPVLSIGQKLVLVSLGYAELFRTHVRASPLVKSFGVRRTVVGGHDVPWVFKR